MLRRLGIKYPSSKLCKCPDPILTSTPCFQIGPYRFRLRSSIFKINPFSSGTCTTIFKSNPLPTRTRFWFFQTTRTRTALKVSHCQKVSMKYEIDILTYSRPSLHDLMTGLLRYSKQEAQSVSNGVIVTIVRS